MWVIINREANRCRSARDSGHRQRFACVFLFFTLRFSNSLWSVSALDFSRSRLCSSWRIWACSNFVWVYGKRQREIQRRKKREAERKKRPIQIKEGDQNSWQLMMKGQLCRRQQGAQAEEEIWGYVSLSQKVQFAVKDNFVVTGTWPEKTRVAPADGSQTRQSELLNAWRALSSADCANHEKALKHMVWLHSYTLFYV